MAPKDLKVLFVCAEVAPFSSIGGLSQVAYFLTRALKKLGVDIRIFSPNYGLIDPQKYPTQILIPSLIVPTGEKKNSSNTPTEIICQISQSRSSSKDDVPIYFLENEEYYLKRANVYGYFDDHIRFALLSKAALEFIKTNTFVPNIIHANDWHTGYLIDYLHHSDKYPSCNKLKKISSILSVHNIYQGMFDFARASEMDFDDGKSQLESFFSDRLIKQNALKRGVMYADIVNTVSETYAQQLMTEEYGGGLHNLFKELRGKIYGVFNGIDTTDFNPITDKVIKKNYSKNTIELRAENKMDLQKQFGLETNPQIPLLAYSGRIDPQKGMDLIVKEIEFIIEELEAQFIIIGPCDPQYTDFLHKLENDHPGVVGTHLMRDFYIPRKIFSGADMILIPSRYEPGGIVAIEAMRYGCVPIVRATGGLADSVEDYNPQKDTGYGFSFKKYSPESFLTAVVRATETYKNKTEWKKIVRRAMEQDFSWHKSAEKYLDLYNRALQFRKEALEPNPPPAFRPMYS